MINCDSINSKELCDELHQDKKSKTKFVKDQIMYTESTNSLWEMHFAIASFASIFMPPPRKAPSKYVGNPSASSWAVWDNCIDHNISLIWRLPKILWQKFCRKYLRSLLCFISLLLCPMNLPLNCKKLNSNSVLSEST